VKEDARTPAVSVVIPTFNREATVLEAIRSAFAQTLVPKEVIVVDDGSTDGTWRLLRQEAQRQGERLRTLRLEHGERGRARNHGIRGATASYVAFLDSDDLWRQDHLEVQVGALEADPGAIAAAGDYGLMSFDGRRVREHVRRTSENGGRPSRRFALDDEAAKLQALVLQRIIIHPSEVVARREAVLACGGFCETVNGAEDWLLWVRLACRGTVVLTGRPTVWLRSSPDNTFSRPGEFARSIVQAADLVAASGLPARVGVSERRVRAIAELHASIALAHGGQRRHALAGLVRALRGEPRVVLDRRFWLSPRALILGRRLVKTARRLRWSAKDEVAAQEPGRSSPLDGGARA